MTTEDALPAALVTRSNILAVGGRGTGKTQAMSDIYHSFYDGQGLFCEGRSNFSIDELFTRINLDKLHSGAATTDEIVEVTQRLQDKIFNIDEVNRCPEITQNQFFSLANGYIILKGRIHFLGNRGYSIVVATANPNDENHTGTFRMDDAFLDRWHLIVDLNYWRKTPEDEERIAQQKRDPRVKIAPDRDISDKIIKAYNSLGQPSAELEFLSRYLTQGLDYCQMHEKAENSKRVLGKKFPVICHEKSCTLKDKTCGIAKPLEERAAQTIIRLAQGLQFIADLKDSQTKQDPLNSVLIAYSLIAPHTRIISKQYIMSDDNFDNPSLAGRNVADKIREELTELLKPDLPVMIAYAFAKNQGDTSYTDKLDKKHAYLKPFFHTAAKEANEK